MKSESEIEYVSRTKAISSNEHVFHIGILGISCLGIIFCLLLGSPHSGAYEKTAIIISAISFFSAIHSLLGSCLTSTTLISDAICEGSLKEACKEIRKDNAGTFLKFSIGLGSLMISLAIHVFS